LIAICDCRIPGEFMPQTTLSTAAGTAPTGGDNLLRKIPVLAISTHTARLISTPFLRKKPKAAPARVSVRGLRGEFASIYNERYNSIHPARHLNTLRKKQNEKNTCTQLNLVAFSGVCGSAVWEPGAQREQPE
jgi:hypothetical protein